MPDMQTEVKKIINSWNLPNEEVQTKAVVTVEPKSFSERVYEYIKSHPQCSLETLRGAFGASKDDTGRLASSLKTLYDRKLIGRSPIQNPNYRGFGRRLVFVYWAVASTYEMQVKGLYSKKKKTVKIVAKKQAKGVEETSTPTKPKVDKPAVNGFDAKAFVNSLNIYDARHVYQLLDIVFGKQDK